MMLKQSFAGAFAFFALASAAQAADMQPVLKAPPAAEPPQQATGYVEVYGGWASTRLNNSDCFGRECESESFRFNGWALGGAGRGNYWFSRDVSLQLDAQAEGTSYDANSRFDRFSTHDFLIGGHWSWRNPQQYLFGVFAGAGDAGGGIAPAQRHAVFGGEAQWYWNQFTLYLQGGYDTTVSTVGFDNVDSINAWFIRSTGRYFVNPNFLLEGTFMYANGNVDFISVFPSQGFQTWVWQAKAEWRFPTAPFSVYAKYQGSETKYDTLSFDGDTFNSKTRDHRVLLGLKLHLGDKTLQQTDRAGATLDIMSPLANPTSPLMLPNFSREVEVEPVLR
jgi:opacity protein-like surface antigen